MPRKGSYGVKKGKQIEALEAQVLYKGVLPTDDGKHDLLLNKDSGLLKVCFHLHFKPMHKDFSYALPVFQVAVSLEAPC